MTHEPTFHELMRPKIENFRLRMVEALKGQNAPAHVVDQWSGMILKMRDNDTMFYVMVRDKICGKWLRKSHKGQYYVDLEAMEGDKKEAISNMGGVLNVFSSAEEEKRWYECACWELDDCGKKAVNAYFSMFGDLYVNHYDTEGIKVPVV